MYTTTMKLSALMSFCLLFCGTSCTTACSDEIRRPDVIEPLMPDKGQEGSGDIDKSSVTQSTVFSAGGNNQVYRIPSIVTTADGAVIVFCEDRHNSWVDKSYTDIVYKLSTDNGSTWSETTSITGSINSGEYAFMDPTPIVDAETGEIFVFFTRWNRLNADVTNNRAFLSRSSDNGRTFSIPEDVSETVLVSGMFSAGFGPGHGISVKDGRFAGRLMAMTRQSDGAKSWSYCLRSDDHGKTWFCGQATLSGEAQTAESGKDRLHLNIRKGASRYVATSTDGGESWSTPVVDASLPTLDSGCEASVLGVGDNMVFWCGPAGGSASAGHDNRYGLKIFRSSNCGATWSRNQVLYEMASGYSDMTILSDGRMAIVFEAGSEKGFIKTADRPAGWLRLDLLILPAELTDYGHWF